VLAHGLIFGQVFFNAAKGSIPTAQPSKMLKNAYKHSEVYIVFI
jgi:hypothetical protein